MSDIDATLKERGARYGSFAGHADISQTLRRLVETYAINRQCDLANDMHEALAMICHKIARILNGDPNYADSWVDIAGYAQLVANRLEGKKSE